MSLLLNKTIILRLDLTPSSRKINLDIRLKFNIKSLIRNSVPFLGFLHNRGVDLYTIGSFFKILNLKTHILFKQFQKK